MARLRTPPRPLKVRIWREQQSNLEYQELGRTTSPNAIPSMSCAAAPNKPMHPVLPSAMTPSLRLQCKTRIHSPSVVRAVERS